MTAPPDPLCTLGLIPGEVIVGSGQIPLHPSAPRTTLQVINTGDRPIQVGSHFHFAQVNDALSFDRAAALGQRLAIAAGTATRFEPGADREVELIPLGGLRLVPGLRIAPTSAGPA